MQQKQWVKPKLIVLARGKPEERVLSGCKGQSSEQTAANGSFYSCTQLAALGQVCCDPTGWGSVPRAECEANPPQCCTCAEPDNS